MFQMMRSVRSIYFINFTLSISAIIVLILDWTLSITFTGLLLQVIYFSIAVSRLKHLNQLSVTIFSFFQKILFQIIFVDSLILISTIIKFCAEQDEFLLKNSIELIIQKFYFLFLFVQIFLIVSLSSSFATIINKMYHEFDSVSKILAINISKTSNYFFFHFLLKAFFISADSFLQSVILIRWIVFRFVFSRVAAGLG